MAASLPMVGALKFPPPAGSFDVTEGSYDLGGFLCGKQEPEVKIWYPTTLTDGPFPIATYGHGMGGQIISDLTASVASLGIVVVAPATSAGKCDDNHWKDMLHALEGSKADPSLHPALKQVDWTRAAVFGHSMGGYGSLNAAANVLQDPSQYSFQLKAMLDSHGYIGDYSGAAHVTIPAMFTTGDEDHAKRLQAAFEMAPAQQKVLAQVQGAQHMEPAENGRLNPFDAHFLGCHLTNLQTSCDKIYGDAADSLCKANTMTTCEVVTPSVVTV
jgi:predicted dienelactone hydrolase